VKELLLNDKKFDEISEYCLEISKEYDWSNTTKELEKLYKILA
jgi:glycosyltransferase involved in cell wall biosynthesis